MNKVYILKESIFDNGAGVPSFHILCVADTKEKCQIELCQQIHMDEQYGGWEHSSTYPKLDSHFDLFEAYNHYDPIPIDSARYWDGSGSTGDRVLAYEIVECSVQ